MKKNPSIPAPPPAMRWNSPNKTAMPSLLMIASVNILIALIVLASTEVTTEVAPEIRFDEGTGQAAVGCDPDGFSLPFNIWEIE